MHLSDRVGGRFLGDGEKRLSRSKLRRLVESICMHRLRRSRVLKSYVERETQLKDIRAFVALWDAGKIDDSFGGRRLSMIFRMSSSGSRWRST